jgi:hypothetical protein
MYTADQARDLAITARPSTGSRAKTRHATPWFGEDARIAGSFRV